MLTSSALRRLEATLMFGPAAEVFVFLCFLLQLLNTVDATVGDVSGLHDKLDRKKKVSPFSPRYPNVSKSFEAQMTNDCCALIKVVCFVTLSVSH